MKRISFIQIILISIGMFSVASFAQGPGEPYFPETANGASNIPNANHYLKWVNPEGAIYNKVFLSYDSMLVAEMDTSVLISSGYPNIAFDSLMIQNLFKVTEYFWKVVEFGSNGFSEGPVWSFYTDGGYWSAFDVHDNFSSGTGLWTITSNSGNCIWQLDDANNYTLPTPAYSNVLAANNVSCTGILNTTAEFQQINNLSYYGAGWVEFDSDWKADNPNDVVIVEVSTDQGNSWRRKRDG